MSNPVVIEKGKKVEVTKEELEQMQKDSKVRLKETAPGEYKKLDRMNG